MSRPDVEWVEPNLREKRLQTMPGDPLFDQQWWLQPKSGSNANTPDARLRGVSDFPDRLAACHPCAVVVAVLDTASPVTPTWPAACCQAMTSSA